MLPFPQGGRYSSPFGGRLSAAVAHILLPPCQIIQHLQMRRGIWRTHAGNLPLHLAIYSLRTVPAINSAVRILARSGDRGMIINPDVSLSSLLTAAKYQVSAENWDAKVPYYEFFRTRNHVWVFRQGCYESNGRQHAPAGRMTNIKISKKENGCHMLTMLPGLLTIRNSRSLSCSRIFTGVDVTGGSCLWTTFLPPKNGSESKQCRSNQEHSLDAITISYDGIRFCDFTINRSHTRF